LIADQGDIAIIIEYEPDTQPQIFISSYMLFDSPHASDEDIIFSYLTACDQSITKTDFSSSAYQSQAADSTYQLQSSSPATTPTTNISKDCRKPSEEQVSTFTAKKKYKPVTLKTQPLLADLPDKFRTIRNIIGNPLADLPILSPHPPPFEPTERYTTERCDIIDKIHKEDFLWPGEHDLMHHFMFLQDLGFAWTDLQRGRFR
jgi:hypothetical protein